MLKLRSESLTWQQVDDEIVCLDLARSEYISINTSGVVLWPQLVEGTDVQRLADTLMTTFDLDRPIAEADVAAFVTMLRGYGLLE